MQSFLTALFATTLALAFATSNAQGEIKAELVSAKMIWAQGPHNVATDLVRFKERWILVCRESTDEYSPDGALRVVASADGATWESAALIKSPTPSRGLGDPKLAVAPDGRLMLAAVGIVPTPGVSDPLPRFGGTLQSMAWYSPDGRTWSKTDYIGAQNFPMSRVVGHKDAAYSYAKGCICGSMQTVEILANPDGTGFKGLYEETFSGFFPEDASIVFAGEVAYCLMSRVSAEIGNARQTGFLGTAKAPYTDWKWKELETRISLPNLIRLPDGQIVAAVGLHDKRARTALCEFDLATGKLEEVLEIPTGGTVMDVGLVTHDGHLWVSYHAARENKVGVYLANVKLK